MYPLCYTEVILQKQANFLFPFQVQGFRSEVGEADMIFFSLSSCSEEAASAIWRPKSQPPLPTDPLGWIASVVI